MKITIDKINPINFTQFISKMKTIENFIALTINDNALESVAYLPQRDAVKMHMMSLNEIFEGVNIPSAVNGKKIKVAFFDGNKLIEAIKQFKTDMVFGEIELIENENDLVASSFKLYNHSMEINLACSDPTFGFKELTQEQINGIFNTEGFEFEFDLDSESLQKVKSLSLLEKDETFTISGTSDSIKIIGSTYSSTISQNKSSSEMDVTIFKKYLNLLDKESYTVKVFENKVMFISNELGTTALTVAPCQNA